MKRGSQRTSFRDELRRILLTYALIPILAATFLLLGILGYILFKNVVNGSQTDSGRIAGQLEELVSDFQEQLSSIAESIDMDRLGTDTAYRTAFNASIYQFVNTRAATPRFYLLNGNSGLLFSTETDAAVREKCRDLIYWRLIRNLPGNSGDALTLLSRSVTQDSTRADLMVGRALFGASGGVIGYACFLLPYQAFEKLVADLASSAVITDQFGSIYLETISAFDGALGKIDQAIQAYSGFSRRDKGTFYISCTPAVSGLFSVYAVRECGGILTSLVMLGIMVTVLFLGLVVVLFFSTKHIADQKTKIIDDIAAAFKSAQEGNLNTRLHINSNDEFEVIGETYNTMLDSIRELMDRSVALAQEMAVSKVKQLESQFNPHFLFNTLENVRFMIRMNPKAAEGMILHLSGLLRYSIQDDSDTVTIAHDMAYTLSYMRILEARFSGRLHYGIDLPQAFENCCIPRLAAQPIIENAVQYGMEAQHAITVSIRVYQSGEDLIMSVTDDGAGIPKDTLARLKASMQNPAVDSKGHLGILNVHGRLRLMYGPAYGVEIHVQEGEGTTVELRFPLQYAKEEVSGDPESIDR